MKGSFLFGMLMVAWATYGASISNVVISQSWPVSTDVRVEYQLSGTEPQPGAGSVPVDIEVQVFDGSREIPLAGLDRAFLHGDVYGVVGDGTHVLYLDPTMLKHLIPAYSSAFKVKLTAQVAPTNAREVIYKAVDLTSGAITDITRADIRNGRYGTWTDDMEETFGITNSVADVLVWTGVTNDVRWATDYMVFRKIPAGGKTFRIGSQEGEKDTDPSREKPYYAKLTHDYWMGVFEVTQAQWTNIAGSNAYSAWNEGPDVALKPIDNVPWSHIRGSNNGVKWSQELTWEEIFATADDYAYIGKFRAKNPTALMRLDLPSDAQWETAARAGVLATHYNGYLNINGANPPADMSMSALGRFSGNGGIVDGIDQGPVRVGSYAPNAYGLYDVLGNLFEWTGDIYMECPSNQVVNGAGYVEDPKGGKANDDAYNGAVGNSGRSPYRGGSYKFNGRTCRLSVRSKSNRGSSNVQVGFRLCVTEE